MEAGCFLPFTFTLLLLCAILSPCFRLHPAAKDGRILTYAVDSHAPLARDAHSPVHQPHHQQQHQQPLSRPQGHAGSQAHSQHLYSHQAGIVAPPAHPHPMLQQHHQGCPSVAEAILRLLPKSVADLAAFQTGCTLASRLAEGARERAGGAPAEPSTHSDGRPGPTAQGPLAASAQAAVGRGEEVRGGDVSALGSPGSAGMGPREYPGRSGGALAPQWSGVGRWGVVTEYERVLGLLPRGMRRRWRVSAANQGYHLCLSYPQHLVLPAEFRYAWIPGTWVAPPSRCQARLRALAAFTRAAPGVGGSEGRARFR